MFWFYERKMFLYKMKTFFLYQKQHLLLTLYCTDVFSFLVKKIDMFITFKRYPPDGRPRHVSAALHITKRCAYQLYRRMQRPSEFRLRRRGSATPQSGAP